MLMVGVGIVLRSVARASPCPISVAHPLACFRGYLLGYRLSLARIPLAPCQPACQPHPSHPHARGDDKSQSPPSRINCLAPARGDDTTCAKVSRIAQCVRQSAVVDFCPANFRSQNSGVWPYLRRVHAGNFLPPSHNVQDDFAG
jgi:hypothetical protein